MAAPTFVRAYNGATDIGGAWATASTSDGGTIGDVVVLHVLQDGATTGAVAITGAANVENLAGTNNAWTTVATDVPVGSPTAALQHIFIGRRLDNLGDPNASGTNSTSEDLYWLLYEFTDVATGSTLATVIENVTAGVTANGFGTSVTISDTAVTTLGSDRLALNLCGLNDDASGLASFAGETGGDWAIPSGALFESASGTDGTVALQAAAMPSAGTINGGTDTIVSMAWGVVGFALIGTTVAATPTAIRRGFEPPEFLRRRRFPRLEAMNFDGSVEPPAPPAFVPRNPAINHQNPGVL